MRSLTFAVLLALMAAVPAALPAAPLTVELGDDAKDATLVAALDRWDQSGNPRRPLDAKAHIEAPAVDFSAVKIGRGRWLFKNLPPGRYDLLILARGRLRLEGFTYPPVLEFDPFFGPDDKVDERTQALITEDIKRSPHYENKVLPLYMGGDKKTVRALVMLIRNLPTSYAPGAGTIRHEIWQYAWQYGGWQKDKRTRVLDRALVQVDELRQWTWLWDPALGGVEVKSQPLTVKYQLPEPTDAPRLKGLYPAAK